MDFSVNLNQPADYYKHLFNQMEQGYTLIEVLFNADDIPVDILYIEANAAAYRMSGTQLAGKRITELDPNYEQQWFEIFGRIATTGQSESHEMYVRPFVGFYRFHAFKVGSPAERKVAVIYENATQLKQLELSFFKREEKYRILFNSIDEAFVVIELLFDDHGKVKDFIYREEDPNHAVNSGLSKVTGKKASEIFPSLEPQWLAVLQEVYATGEAVRGEDYNADTGRWYRYYHSRVGGPGNPFIATVSTDITERKSREQHQEYIVKLSDALRPIVDPKEVQRVAMQVLGEHLNVDRAIYAEINIDEDWFEAIDNFTSQSVQKVTGRFPFSAFGPPGEELKKGERLIIHDVATQVDNDSKEAFYSMNVHAVVAVPLIKQGELVADLSVHQTMPRHWLDNEIALIYETAERTWAAVERAKAEKALKAVEEQYRVHLETEVEMRTAELKESQLLLQTIIDSSLSHIQVFKAIRNEKGEVVDFNWVMTNKGFSDISGDMTGKRLLAQNPAVIETGIFDDMKKILETGEPQVKERFYNHEQFNGWFHQVLVRMDDGVIMTTDDITSRKKTQLALSENRNLLQATLDSSLDMIQVFKAVRDEAGNIIDFIWILNNHTSEQIYGDVIEKSLLQNNPGVRTTGIFDELVKVTETGIPQQYERHYVYEQFDGWFYQSVVKLNDGVATSTADITSRKMAEDERFKNYLLLQQTEDVALLGSWEYDLSSCVFTWSDGMYRLFDLEKGTEIKPEIYLKYATNEGQAAAKRVVDHICTGNTDFEETLEISVADQVKVLHLKAAVVKNAEGHATRVLGVDMDVTAMRTAEERIRKMEAEQQLEIFRVSLSTLEEERRRISESLHNGIGQILYGVKLSLNNLNQKDSNNDFDEIKNYTNTLLTDAIIETRRISHELMPTTLQDFGLKSAIDDICKQLSDGVKFSCQITGLHSRLEKYLELAVYRTVQELMTNVVKHAKATTAIVRVDRRGPNIKVIVSDNGQGIEAIIKKNRGIGLSSIRSKIKLLNGEVSVDTGPEKGTTVEVIIPIPEKNI